LRVVFDSNVFGPERFDLLDNSPIRSLCKQGRMVAIYGDRLLDETLRTYGYSDRREELVKRWLPFIKETAGRIGLMMHQIWDVELVQGFGLEADVYMSKEAQDEAFRDFRKLALDGSWKGWDASKAEREEDHNKRTRLHEAMKWMRQTIKEQFDPTKHGEADWNQYLASELDVAGRGYIMEGFLSCRRRHAIAERWSFSKDLYPFYTSFVCGTLYAAFYAMTTPNALDRNALADLDVMAHLLRADALVSNEMKFLRTAFDHLWRPTGKELYTSEQFSALIKRL
jgi:hypothetical protein